MSIKREEAEGIVNIPEISIVMATNKYNNHLEEAIDSILTQTFTKFEFIIVANGMNEEEYGKLHTFTLKDKRIKLYNTGIKQLQYNLNYAIDHSLAEIIARMDGDDIALPKRLEKQFFYLKTNDLDFIGSDFFYMNGEGETINKKTHFVRTDVEIRKSLEIFCTFCHPTLMYKKAIVQGVGGYCFGSISEDWDLFLRLRRNKNIRFGNHPEKLLKYRRHAGQMSTQKEKIYSVIISQLYWREFLYTKDWAYIKGVILYYLLSTPLNNILKKIEQWRRK